MSVVGKKHEKRYAPRRGWPVVATGTPPVPSMGDYLRWRARLGLPEESPDFSDRDVFDVIEFLLEQERTRPWNPRLMRKSLAESTEGVRHHPRDADASNSRIPAQSAPANPPDPRASDAPAAGHAHTYYAASAALSPAHEAASHEA